MICYLYEYIYKRQKFHNLSLNCDNFDTLVTIISKISLRSPKVNDVLKLSDQSERQFWSWVIKMKNNFKVKWPKWYHCIISAALVTIQFQHFDHYTFKYIILVTQSKKCIEVEWSKWKTVLNLSDQSKNKC